MNGYCPHLGLSPPHWEILDPSLINGNIVYNYQKIAVQFLILLKTYSKFSSGRREHFSCVNNGRYSHIFRFMENLLFPFVGNLHKSYNFPLHRILHKSYNLHQHRTLHNLHQHRILHKSYNLRQHRILHKSYNFHLQ